MLQGVSLTLCFSAGEVFLCVSRFSYFFGEDENSTLQVNVEYCGADKIDLSFDLLAQVLKYDYSKQVSSALF